MKNNYLKLIFVLFISFLLCSEKEKYSLIPENTDFGIGYMVKYRYSEEISFDLPGMGRIRLINNYISNEEWLGKENGIGKIKIIRTEIDAANWIGSEYEHPYEYLAMDGAPCLVYLKEDGLILIREPEISFFLRFFLYILNDEAWSYNVNIFDSRKEIFDPNSPWDANNATATLLFKNEREFYLNFPQFTIIKNKLSEFLIFLNSGGVVQKKFCIPTNRFFFNLLFF